MGGWGGGGVLINAYEFLNLRSYLKAHKCFWNTPQEFSSNYINKIVFVFFLCVYLETEQLTKPPAVK